MAYTYTLEQLLAVLRRKGSSDIDGIAGDFRRVDHGLMSVGLKIHCLDGGPQFGDIITELGGAEKVLNNRYKRYVRALCWVLPPVGSARTAIRLLEAVEVATNSRIFNNARAQIQVCSPKSLGMQRSALLAIGFYLGSDQLRRFQLSDLSTTFSGDSEGPTGKRFVLYDANGSYDDDFEWWGVKDGALVKTSKIPKPHKRIDLLTATSRLDVHNINLLATFLGHAEHSGYWGRLGRSFEREMEALLREHLLAGLLTLPWIRTSDLKTANDFDFFAGLQELTAYAFGEVVRIQNKRRAYLWKKQGVIERKGNTDILHQMQTLLQKYRRALVQESHAVNGGAST